MILLLHDDILQHSGIITLSLSNMTHIIGYTRQHEAPTLTPCWPDVGPTSATLAQHQTKIGSLPRVCWGNVD